MYVHKRPDQLNLQRILHYNVPSNTTQLRLVDSSTTENLPGQIDATHDRDWGKEGEQLQEVEDCKDTHKETSEDATDKDILVQEPTGKDHGTINPNRYALICAGFIRTGCKVVTDHTVWELKRVNPKEWASHW